MKGKNLRPTRMLQTTVVACALLLGAAYLPSGTLSAGWVYIGETPNLVISPSVIPLKKGAKVTIAGSGFEKGQELGIRLMMGGVVSDIRHQVKPAPKVGADGSFHSVWTLGNEPRLIPAGSMSIKIVNEDGDVLAHAPVVWAKEAKKDAKKKKK